MKRLIANFLAVIALSFFGMATARAQAVDCASITDATRRLQCYDLKAAPKAPAVQPNAVQAPIGDAERRQFTSRLEKVFLSSGVPAELIIEGTSKPKLTIWTYLNRASVYQLITQGNVLVMAKEVGFATVDFWDKGSEGHWIYDLSKPGPLPNCDKMRRLCS